MSAQIVCFGEVLWDVFPDRRKIGGAPLNVALRLSSFGNTVSMISSVGHDQPGSEILDFIGSRGLDLNAIQKSDKFKTGEVQVTLDGKGSASYEIVFPTAWDDIILTADNIRLVKQADALVFGSLAARGDTSRTTLFDLIDLAAYRIFDINLRPPHYDQPVLEHLMNSADFIKFNDDELFEIASAMSSNYNSLEQNIKFIAEKTRTRRICVTKGRHGAVLFYDGSFFYNSGYLVKVADTVGAGDSFLATVTHHLLNGNDPQKAIDHACAVGALVAGSKGANPEISEARISNFINPKAD